jgi:3-hydroxybutyryl-CoA dehydrogenase
MHILVNGPAARRGKLLSSRAENPGPGSPSLVFTENPRPTDLSTVDLSTVDLSTVDLSTVDLIIDLSFDQHPELLHFYAAHTHPGSFFILHANTLSLRETAHSLGLMEHLPRIAGVNAWPGCLDGPLWEMSVGHDAALDQLKRLSEALGFLFERVEDRVGLVTPRVMCMIINEAYLTLQEGTADRADIDLAMKLGTNYPGGPFEWAERWGLGEVSRMLHCLQSATGDPRYKRSKLLIEEALAFNEQLNSMVNHMPSNI